MKDDYVREPAAGIEGRPHAFSWLVSSMLSALTSADKSTWTDFADFLQENQAVLRKQWARRQYRALIIEATPDLKARLLAVNQEMYGEYDRLAAEASFRVNVVLPMWVITFLVIKGLNFPWKVTWHELHSTNNQVFDQAWGVIPLVAGFILLVQGANRLALSRNVLMRAVTTQTVGFPRTLVIEPDKKKVGQSGDSEGRSGVTSNDGGAVDRDAEAYGDDEADGDDGGTAVEEGIRIGEDSTVTDPDRQ